MRLLTAAVFGRDADDVIVPEQAESGELIVLVDDRVDGDAGRLAEHNACKLNVV